MAASEADEDTLDADTLQRLLSTHTFGRVVHIHAQTASTNDDLKLLAHQGAPEGTLVLADRQTHGRGRQGRTFASPAGVGVYASLLVRPRLSPAQLPPLTLIVAVAAAEAIADVCALAVRLKWPNDVEVDGKKVAGILTETVLCRDGTLAVIIGIGINVNTTLDHMPPPLQPRVTSLARVIGTPVARLPLLARLLARLEHLYGCFQDIGPSASLERWRHYADVAGRRVRWAPGTVWQEGTALDIDAAGALLVQADTGHVQRVLAGEVVFL